MTRNLENFWVFVGSKQGLVLLLRRAGPVHLDSLIHPYRSYHTHTPRPTAHGSWSWHRYPRRLTDQNHTSPHVNSLVVSAPTSPTPIIPFPSKTPLPFPRHPPRGPPSVRPPAALTDAWGLRRWAHPVIQSAQLPAAAPRTVRLPPVGPARTPDIYTRKRPPVSRFQYSEIV